MQSLSSSVVTKVDTISGRATAEGIEVVQWAERSDIICVIRHFECQKQ